MKRVNVVLMTVGVLTFLGVSLIGLAMPTAAYAGGVSLSIGIGIPFPVAVAPAPVLVAPAPVVVQPAPVVVQPPPVVMYQEPVMIAQPYPVYQPYAVYPRPLPPGLAKKYYGYRPVRGYKFYR